MSFTGNLTAIVTPFHSDGSLDLDTLTSLVEWQIESGVQGLVPCGSTGEAATLSHEEHVEVVRHVVSVAAGRVPVVAGAGSNSTREAVSLSREAKAAGADAALLISPYYNKPTQEGIFEHYRAVAEESGLPIFIYNIPGRTASRIEPQTLARLSRVPGIAGYKECGGDFTNTAATKLAAADDFLLFSGDDAITLPLLALGADGVISTIGNLVPDQMTELVSAFKGGNLARAQEIHFRLLPLMQALGLETNPIPVKTALQLMGRIPDATMRLPLTAMQKTHIDTLEAALVRLQLR